MLYLGVGSREATYSFGAVARLPTGTPKQSEDWAFVNSISAASQKPRRKVENKAKANEEKEPVLHGYALHGTLDVPAAPSPRLFVAIVARVRPTHYRKLSKKVKHMSRLGLLGSTLCSQSPMNRDKPTPHRVGRAKGSNLPPSSFLSFHLLVICFRYFKL